MAVPYGSRLSDIIDSLSLVIHGWPVGGVLLTEAMVLLHRLVGVFFNLCHLFLLFYLYRTMWPGRMCRCRTIEPLVVPFCSP
ncbi:hypothetical protein DSUL_50427 [Desulfovibrionales bacterium]